MTRWNWLAGVLIAAVSLQQAYLAERKPAAPVRPSTAANWCDAPSGEIQCHVLPTPIIPGGWTLHWSSELPPATTIWTGINMSTGGGNGVAILPSYGHSCWIASDDQSTSVAWPCPMTPLDRTNDRQSPEAGGGR